VDHVVAVGSRTTAQALLLGLRRNGLVHHLNVVVIIIVVVVVAVMTVGRLLVVLVVLLLLLMQTDAQRLHTHAHSHAYADAHIGTGHKVKKVCLREILGTKGLADVHASRCGHILGADHLLSLKRQISAFKNQVLVNSKLRGMLEKKKDCKISNYIHNATLSRLYMLHCYRSYFK